MVEEEEEEMEEGDMKRKEAKKTDRITRRPA